MHLDGARNAKAEIFRNVLGYEEVAGLGRILPSFAPRIATADAAEPNPGILGRIRRRIDLGSAFRRVMDLSTSADFEMREGPAASRGVDVAPPALAIGLRRRRTQSDECQLVLFGEYAWVRDHPMVEQAMAVARGEALFVATGEIRLLPSLWDPPRLRPLQAGLSVAHVRSRPGTIGGFVRRGDELFILSNNHVLADTNKGRIEDPIIQPAAGDGGSDQSDVVGFLADFVPIETDPGRVNDVDCAIARLAEDVEGSAALMCLAGEQARTISGVGEDDLFVDDEVWKTGRTSGLTKGRVFAAEVDNYVVNVGSAMHPVRARFHDQIQVWSEGRNFSSPGDSGSLVIDVDGLARGLLFAGTSGNGPGGVGLTAVNPIAPVLRKLSAELWTG